MFGKKRPVLILATRSCLRGKQSAACRQRGAIAIVIAVAAAAFAFSDAAASRTISAPAPGAPNITPEEEQARIANSLSQLSASGWKLTASGEAIRSGKLVREVASADRELMKLAYGEGRRTPAAVRSASANTARTRARTLQSLRRVQGHQTAYLYCNYGAQGNIMYWTGATSSTYINFLEESIWGALASYRTPSRTCSAVEQPCLWYGFDDPTAEWRVDWGTPYARYASHSLYDSWCSY